MRHARFGVLALSVFCAVSFSARAQETPEVEPTHPTVTVESDAPIAEVPSAWLVELRGVPAADGGSLADLAQEKQAFRAAAQQAGVRFQERYSYDHLRSEERRVGKECRSRWSAEH